MAFSSDNGKLSFNPPSLISSIFGTVEGTYKPVDEKRFNTLASAFENLSNRGSNYKDNVDNMVNAQKKLGNGFDLVVDGCKKANGEFDTSKMTYENYTNAVNEANAAQKKLTVSQRALSSVKSLGGNILSGVLNIGTGMLAGVAISGIVSLIDGIVHRSDNLIQAGEEAKSEIQTITQEYDSHKQAVDSVIDSYDTLRSKVNQSTNQNMGLSSAEYQEFLDMNNQLASMFPTLVSGYDSQGNAIINLGNSASEAKTKLQGLLDVEQQSNSREIAEKGQEHYEGVAEQAKKIQKEIKQEKKNYEDALETAQKYSEMTSNISKGLEDRSIQLPGSAQGARMKATVEEALKEQGIDYSTGFVPNEYGGKFRQD